MLYDEPKYYEIAFSFRDIPFEVDLFEECFKRFSKISVKSLLELGCGNSPHMKELVKRGYEYTGVDLNEAMLEYSREKADKIEGKIDLCKADMVNFSLDTPFDLKQQADVPVYSIENGQFKPADKRAGS